MDTTKTNGCCYQFDDNIQFPKAVNLAIDLDDELRGYYTKAYFNDKVELSKDDLKKLLEKSSELHELMRRLEEQAAFPKE